jgi:hypothetical protein
MRHGGGGVGWVREQRFLRKEEVVVRLGHADQVVGLHGGLFEHAGDELKGALGGGFEGEHCTHNESNTRLSFDRDEHG